MSYPPSTQKNQEQDSSRILKSLEDYLKAHARKKDYPPPESILRLTSAIKHSESNRDEGNGSGLFWSLYNAKASTHKDEKMERASTDLDSLLTFAGLFSGVDTAFIAMTLALISNEDYNMRAVATNAIFITSLSLSVLAAFGAVIGKQWIADPLYAPPWLGATAKEIAVDHQMQLSAIDDWQLFEVLDFLPLVLQFSILTFWLGITIYLWHRLNEVAVVTLVFASIGALWYGSFFGTATLDPQCPFQTPVSRLFSSWLRAKRIGNIGSVAIKIVRILALLIFFVVFYVAQCVRGRVDPSALTPFITIGMNSDEIKGSRTSPSRNKDLRIRDSGNQNEPPPLPDFAFKCIQWALEDLQDSDIALEAARQIPNFSERETISLFANKPEAFNTLLHHFLRRISTEDAEQACNALITFSAAVAHALLTQPQQTMSYDALATIHQELHDLCSRRESRDIPALAGLSLFTDILYGRYIRTESPSLPSRPQEMEIIIRDEFLSALELDYKRNLPILYLALSFGGRITDEKLLAVERLLANGNTATACVTLCASKLPPRQAISLVHWYLSTEKSGFDPDHVEDIERRWEAYTSPHAVADEVEQILQFIFPSDSPSNPPPDFHPLFVTILDNASRLERGSLGSGSAIKTALSSLLRSIKEKKDAGPRIFAASRSPCFLVRLASYDEVDQETRLKALEVTSCQKLDWGDHAFAKKWGVSFVDGLVGCFGSWVRSTAEERTTLLKHTCELASSMQTNVVSKQALFDVPSQALQRRLQELQPTSSTSDLNYLIPYEQTSDIVLFSLAIWGILGGPPNDRDSERSPIIRGASTRWDGSFANCVTNVIRDAGGIKTLPLEIQTGHEKYTAYMTLHGSSSTEVPDP